MLACLISRPRGINRDISRLLNYFDTTGIFDIVKEPRHGSLGGETPMDRNRRVLHHAPRRTRSNNANSRQQPKGAWLEGLLEKSKASKPEQRILRPPADPDPGHDKGDDRFRRPGPPEHPEPAPFQPV